MAPTNGIQDRGRASKASGSLISADAALTGNSRAFWLSRHPPIDRHDWVTYRIDPACPGLAGDRSSTDRVTDGHAGRPIEHLETPRQT
jgi:hypothetical protein